MTLRNAVSLGATMKALTGPAELVEKDRIRLEINAQVEEFLRRGGAIELATCHTEPAGVIVGSVWDQEEFTPYSD